MCVPNPVESQAQSTSHTADALENCAEGAEQNLARSLKGGRVGLKGGWSGPPPPCPIGQRPIGTAKGKQPNTKALCQTPPHWC